MGRCRLVKGSPAEARGNLEAPTAPRTVAPSRMERTELEDSAVDNPVPLTNTARHRSCKATHQMRPALSLGCGDQVVNGTLSSQPAVVTGAQVSTGPSTLGLRHEEGEQAAQARLHQQARRGFRGAPGSALSSPQTGGVNAQDQDHHA